MLTTHERNAKIKLAAIVVSVIVIAGIVALADHLKSKNHDMASTTAPSGTAATQSVPDTSSDSAASTTPSGTSSSPGAASNSSSTSSLKDGIYTASDTYIVPPGKESIQVTVTLQNGVITASSIQNSENDHDSAQFQQDFAAVYKSHVVGKNISGLKLGALAGASDTADAFNQAISQITSKAQA
jgi:hypothetical protein